MQWGEPWTREQASLVDVVLSAWVRHGNWPIFEYVASALDKSNVDAFAVLQSFPVLGARSLTSRWYADVQFDYLRPHPAEDSEVKLAVSALARHRYGVETAHAFVAVLAFAADRHLEASLDPTKLAEVSVSSQEVLKIRTPEWPPGLVRNVEAVLRTEWPVGMHSMARATDTGSWTIAVSRAIRRYVGLTLEKYLLLIQQDVDAPSGESATYDESSNGQATTLGGMRSMKPEKAIQELRRLRLEADDPSVRANGPAHDEWRAKVRAVLQRALGDKATALQSFEGVRYWIGVYTGAPGEDQRDREYFADQVGVAAAFIDAAIYELELDADPESPSVVPAPADREGVGTIFIVHGRDDGLKAQVQNLVERSTKADVIVLHQQADEGRTVIEKFEAHAQQSMFAVILLTPDDEGRLRGSGELRDRARQNVVFEHGYFIGRLGRSRVVALYKGDVELPSDLSGIIYKHIDAGETWKYELAKELRAASIEIDMNKVV